jgi:FtsH-binding integral membrane protein
LEIEIMSYSENPYQQNPYQAFGEIAARAGVDERTDFIRKTYLHLAGAVLAFIGIEAAVINSPLAESIMGLFQGNGNGGMIVVLLAFIGVSFLANYWAQSATSVPLQYAGLALYVVAEAFIFVPLLYTADRFMPGIIPQAAMVTAIMFGGLTAIVFVTGHDFSYLRGILWMVGLGAVLICLWAMFFHKYLGIPFSIAMIVFACGYILYDTSNVIHRYRIGQHVAASLALFASVAMLFFYVLRLLMQLNRR